MTAPSSPKEIAARLLALRVVRDWIAAEDRRLREQAAALLDVGDRVTGLLDPDDKATPLGFVLLAKGRQAATVTDGEAFLAWAGRVAPTEIVTVRKVRESFTASVLADVKSHGGWISPDGELLAPDGVELRTGEPVLSVKPTAEADGLVAAALAARRLALGPGVAS